MIVIKSIEVQNLEDAELIHEFMIGNQEAFNVLLERYTDKINFIAKRFFSNGMTFHDVFQEGAIGLLIAVRKYQAERGSFQTFAELQIRSQIINAIKGATRKKHSALNNSYSADRLTIDGRDSRTFLDLFQHPEPSPEEILLRKYEEYEIKQKVTHVLNTQLTKLERNALLKICAGSSYKDAAIEIGIGTKSIDNALRRVKKKLAGFDSKLMKTSLF